MAATALGHDDEATGAIIPPPHPSTTFLRDQDNLYRRGRMYARADNPTYKAAADTITALEGGAATLLFSSGMAAANTVFGNRLPLELAQRLSAIRRLSKCCIPACQASRGAKSHSGRCKADSCGMLSIRVAGGEPAAMTVAAHVAIWKRATSLGSVESLIEHRASIEGEGLPFPRTFCGCPSA